MRRFFGGTALCALLIVAATSSGHGQSRLAWTETISCNPCQSEDCVADYFTCIADYVIEAVQRCPTAPPDRVYETGWSGGSGDGTCMGDGPGCGIFPQCDPTFKADTFDDGPCSPGCHHVFRLTIVSKQLTYSGGLYSCQDTSTQVYETIFTKLPEGAPPCDQ